MSSITGEHSAQPHHPPRPDNHSRTSTSSFFTYPVTYAVSGLIRRLNTDPLASSKSTLSDSQISYQSEDSMNGVYTPPKRHASPFQPPPLTPLTLTGHKSETAESARLLTKSLAEEIRLLVPARLQLVETWSLAYSLEQDGVSLATMYKKCDDYVGRRGGFVLVVRDGGGGVSTIFIPQTSCPPSRRRGS